ncbi:type III polyketide synthase [Stieleria sp. TO1_6]|uniref:type III polyketide synthase n=1 Tax=Stieleria tagensis TaxID=2956795 RepID=UPI00209B8248|nr:type III polyketide synthase [Stieleria tagensis]MCO8124601.1 type III polyketide synthase [Stieleria tagensis]
MPGQEVTQDDALAMSSDIICQDERQKRLLRMLFRKSGVTSRRTVIPWKTAYFWNKDGGAAGRGPGTGDRMSLYERYAPPLATEACRQAMGMDASDLQLVPIRERLEGCDPLGSDGEVQSDGFGPISTPLKIDPASVTHLVTVSCTGFAAPGLDWHLFDALGLSPQVQRVQVGFMGCHGGINGLRAARGLAAADPDAVVLLCAVELCSLHYRMSWEDEAMVGNALFADGSAAVVIVGRNRVAEFSQGISIIDCASIRIPDSDDQMSWRIGDHGFDMTLTGQVPGSIQGHLQEWLSQWLAPHGLSPESIGDWIVHPGGPRILDATEQALGLPENELGHSREVLSELGNMSSPTVLFVLQRALRAGNTGPRVVLAFGPGLVAEATLLG